MNDHAAAFAAGVTGKADDFTVVRVNAGIVQRGQKLRGSGTHFVAGDRGQAVGIERIGERFIGFSVDAAGSVLLDPAQRF